jgi:hypothetical protein
MLEKRDGGIEVSEQNIDVGQIVERAKTKPLVFGFGNNLGRAQRFGEVVRRLSRDRLHRIKPGTAVPGAAGRKRWHHARPRLFSIPARNFERVAKNVRRNEEYLSRRSG